MGMYSLKEVMTRWERGNLSSEQVIGQLLLLVQDLSDRVGNIEKIVVQMRSKQKDVPTLFKPDKPDDEL